MICKMMTIPSSRITKISEGCRKLKAFFISCAVDILWVVPFLQKRGRNELSGCLDFSEFHE
jgi:hypothetical protein